MFNNKGTVPLGKLPREVKMKSDFTFCGKQTEFAKTISVIIVSSPRLFSAPVLPTAQENLAKKSDIDNQQEDEKEFTFHQNKNGKDNIWKAVFKDGKLTELYKNGQKIPDENLEDYTDMVNEETGRGAKRLS